MTKKQYLINLFEKLWEKDKNFLILKISLEKWLIDEEQTNNLFKFYQKQVNNFFDEKSEFKDLKKIEILKNIYKKESKEKEDFNIDDILSLI